LRRRLDVGAPFEAIRRLSAPTHVEQQKANQDARLRDGLAAVRAKRSAAPAACAVAGDSTKNRAAVKNGGV